MKQTIFTTFLLLSILSFISCKKTKIQPNIKQYDQTQILNYIADNHLTGFVRDTVGGDTTGIYYKIITPGNPGTPLAYNMQMPMVYTLQTFDGTYVSSDTIANHFYDYAGHLQSGGYPLGLQTAIINDLKYEGGRMRVLIPSHLAYGFSGKGSGSSQVANNRIQGNECLDYYINIPKLDTVPHNNPNAYAGVTSTLTIDTNYDQLVIQNYMRDSSLVGYTRTADGLWYKVLTQATASDPVTINSTITATYTAQIYNATIVDNFNVTGGTPFNIADLIPGVQEGLENTASVGTKVSLLIPSSLAYGLGGNGSIPPFSCLRFTWQIVSVTP